MREDQEDPTTHYTINRHTHYTVQYKDANCTWVGGVGKIEHYNSIAEAEAAIKETFANVYQHHVEQATIIEWKKTPIAVKKNNTRFMESTACCYDVEVHYDTCPDDLRPLWKVRRSNFESLKEAQEYVKNQSVLDCLLHKETFRIVKREMTSKYSVVG